MNLPQVQTMGILCRGQLHCAFMVEKHTQGKNQILPRTLQDHLSVYVSELCVYVWYTLNSPSPNSHSPLSGIYILHH